MVSEKRKKRTIIKTAVIGLTALAFLTFLNLVGFDSFPENPTLDRVDPSRGYRFENLEMGEKNTDENMVILSLSGGGIRAAALGYGVLQYLRDIRIEKGSKTLLDEVDVMTTSSTSSAVAAYFGLFGEEKFFRDFKEEFLHHRLERALVLRLLNPLNWPRLISPLFSRSEIVMEYMNDNVFEGRTFSQMPRRRPYIIMNATDMSLGAQFSFVQNNFDRLCSDLDGVSVARGVVASMAFSVAFTPIALLNYPKEVCGYRRPPWVETALRADLEDDPIRFDHARNWVAYEDAEARPYIHLLDGGISDNIGVRAVATAVITSDSEWGLTEMLEAGEIKRLAVIIVDAKTRNSMDKDKKPRPPGIPSVLVASAGNPMANYSSETVDRLNTFFRFMTEVSGRLEKGRAACDDMAADICLGSASPEECRTERRHRCYEEFQVTDRDRPPLHPALSDSRAFRRGQGRDHPPVAQRPPHPSAASPGGRGSADQQGAGPAEELGGLQAPSGGPGRGGAVKQFQFSSAFPPGTLLSTPGPGRGILYVHWSAGAWRR